MCAFHFHCEFWPVIARRGICDMCAEMTQLCNVLIGSTPCEIKVLTWHFGCIHSFAKNTSFESATIHNILPCKHEKQGYCLNSDANANFQCMGCATRPPIRTTGSFLCILPPLLYFCSQKTARIGTQRLRQPVNNMTYCVSFPL